MAIRFRVLYAGGKLRNAPPPIFLFGACPKRKIAPRPVEERKGRFHAGFRLTIVEPVPADVRVFLKTGCNRGKGCRLCFRAETLRLALRGAGGEVFCTVFPPLSGESNGGPRAPLAVSIREILRRGRKRNLPLLSAASFATFLRASEEKLNNAGHLLNPRHGKRFAPTKTRRIREAHESAASVFVVLCCFTSSPAAGPWRCAAAGRASAPVRRAPAHRPSAARARCARSRRIPRRPR